MHRRQRTGLFTEELPWLKGRDLNLMMGEALCRWIGWPLPAQK
jgi:L-fuconolactonase